MRFPGLRELGQRWFVEHAAITLPVLFGVVFLVSGLGHAFYNPTRELAIGVLELLASASGGQKVELPDLAGIADQLKGETKLTERHREVTLWDNWLTVLLLVMVYSLDVGLRRLTGLS